MNPMCIDLFCGLGGWAEGFLAENYRVIGFDIERHDYGRGSYPGQLVLQDARTLHGSQFKDATVIVASPPCTEPSYRAMPWKEARAIKPDVLPEWWNKCEFNPKAKESKVPMMTPEEMTEWRQYQLDHPLSPPSGFIELFDTCFRIQREASVAAGRHIPMVVENVRGAQRWVGRAKWHFGSYYLWGDVPALMPTTFSSFKSSGMNWSDQTIRGQDFTRLAGKHCEAQKVPGFRFDGSGRSFQTAAVHVSQTIAASSEATKGNGSWFGDYREAKAQGRGTGNRYTSSNSIARKAASAEIAKIPFPLAEYIARTYSAAVMK